MLGIYKRLGNNQCKRKIQRIPFKKKKHYNQFMVRGDKQRKPTVDLPNEDVEIQRDDSFSLFEVNLLRYPVCLLSNNNLNKLLRKTVDSKQSYIHYEFTDGQGIKRVWKMYPNAVLGYPSPFDKKVLGTILKLLSDQGLGSSNLWKLGSVKRLCREMGISDRGANPGRVRKSLSRWGDARFRANCFYVKDGNRYWVDEKKLHKETVSIEQGSGSEFSLWNVHWKGEKLPTGETAETIYLELLKPFILGLRSVYMKPIDYQYWLGLAPVPQRLYELTGIKFYGLKNSEYVVFDYPDLCQAMPILPQKYFNNAKQVLEAAHKELKKTGWLRKFEWIGQRKYRGQSELYPWQIRYYPGERAIVEIDQAKERNRRFQMKRVRQELPNWDIVQEVSLYLAELLGRSEKNRGYYIKWGRLVANGSMPRSLVFEWAHVAKTETNLGNAADKPAYFTGIAKKWLKQERNQDLKELLSTV